MLEELKYFVGKACTITTTQINYRFKDEIMMDYFSGVIDKITDNGILVTHPQTGSKNFIFLKYVVSISEEQMVFEDDPQYKEIVEEYRQKKPELAEKTKVNNKFVDLSALTEIAKKAKEGASK